MQSFRFSDQSFVSKFLSLTTFNNADSITFNNADLIKSALLKVVSTEQYTYQISINESCEEKKLNAEVFLKTQAWLMCPKNIPQFECLGLNST